MCYHILKAALIYLDHFFCCCQNRETNSIDKTVFLKRRRHPCPILHHSLYSVVVAEAGAGGGGGDGGGEGERGEEKEEEENQEQQKEE